MNPTVPSINVREFMINHLVEVFDTMLSMKATLNPKSDLPHFAERVTGSVGFAGETVQGIVYLHLSASFAHSVAVAMLGLPPEEPTGEADVNDVIGEVTNMLTGGLKSALCDAGATCAVSTPAIIRGSSFAIEPAPELQRIWLVFDCGTEQVAVEIHIQFR